MMSKDGCRKIAMHLTLKAGVIFLFIFLIINFLPKNQGVQKGVRKGDQKGVQKGCPEKGGPCFVPNIIKFSFTHLA